jgi:hypothetical protein
MVTRKDPIMFKANPALIISWMVSFPEPKTIALGGVATGSINAQLAAKTTGIVKAYWRYTKRNLQLLQLLVKMLR